MPDQYSRTRLLLGDKGMDKLRASRVAVFGLGGVGGYAVEALARSGIGQLDLIDDDVIGLTNLNRQILALHSTVGISKVEASAQRIRDIDPTIQVRTYKTFYLPETANEFDFTQYDYVLDAIDTVTGKLALIAQAKAANVPIISCMGTGNKLDATGFRVSDISKTSGCALARIMLPLEPHIDPSTDPESHREGSSRRALPGSTAFVPGVAGLIMAGEVIKDLAGEVE